MNDELKKAIERLRNAPVVSKSGCMLGCDKWDIAAVCAAAEKAMRVVEMANEYVRCKDGLECDYRMALLKSLAAMEEP